MSETFDMRQFVERLRVLERQVAGAGNEALVQAAEQLVGDAAELCPVEWGTLAGSGTVDDSKVRSAPPGTVGQVTFGFNTSYAAAVHERTDVHHGQGQAKYLEAAINAGLPRINGIIGREIAASGLKD